MACREKSIDRLRFHNILQWAQEGQEKSCIAPESSSHMPFSFFSRQWYSKHKKLFNIYSRRSLLLDLLGLKAQILWLHRLSSDPMYFLEADVYRPGPSSKCVPLVGYCCILLETSPAALENKSGPFHWSSSIVFGRSCSKLIVSTTAICEIWNIFDDWHTILEFKLVLLKRTASLDQCVSVSSTVYWEVA